MNKLELFLNRTSFINVSGNWQFNGEMTPERAFKIFEELTLVRPGKHQCDNPNCVQNNSKPESVPSQQAKIHKSEIVQKVLDSITPEEMAETERKMMEESVPSCGEENVPHDAINLLNLNFGNSKVAYWTIKDRIAVLMQEYAQQSMKQERERVIQECIEMVREKSPYPIPELIWMEIVPELEKLKK